MKKLLLFFTLLCPYLAISQTAPQPISSFPYIEDFENGTAGWTSGGIQSNTSSWVYSAPITNITSQKTAINYAASGTGYWVTCDTFSTSPAVYFTKHLRSERSYLLSPAFDLTSISNPVLAVKIWWDTEDCCDGTTLQFSLDSAINWKTLGAYGDSGNWYNRFGITSRPGGQHHAWTGNSSMQGPNTSSNGWVTATYPLDSLAGHNNVLFRFAFASDGSIHLNGFGIDDFMIFEAGTMVLGEKEELRTGSLQVYPNPSTGIFNLQLPETTQSTTLKVYDLKGQLVKETKLLNGARITELDLANQPKGIYLLKAENGNQLYTQKLVIQ